jgi:diguanylate cyclase (GGDEF)-like protein/PAS domain S-box-containing protein
MIFIKRVFFIQLCRFLSLGSFQLKRAVLKSQAIGLILGLFSLSSYAFQFEISPQPVSAQDKNALSPIKTLYSLEINQFYQDPAGFIWIISEQGIYRFDGMNLDKLYPASNQSSSGDNLADGTHAERQAVQSLSFQNNNALWISTRKGLVKQSISSLPEAQLNEFLEFPSTPARTEHANWILGSEPLNDDSRWVVTQNGVYLYTQQGNDIQYIANMDLFYNGQSKLLSYHIQEDILWLGASDGLYSYHLKNKQLNKPLFQDRRPITDVTTINSAKTGQLLFAAKQGLFAANVKNDQLFNVQTINSSSISALTVGNNLIYYIVDKHLFSHDLINAQAEKILDLSHLDLFNKSHTAEVSALFLDQENQLWIATRRHGTFLLPTNAPASKRFNLNLMPSNLTTAAIKVNQTLQDGQHLWLATNRGLLLSNQDELSQTNRASNSLTNSIIQTIPIAVEAMVKIEDSLWLASHDGLLQYKKSAESIQQYEPSHIEPTAPFYVYELAQTDPRTLWLATNLGLMKYDIALSRFSYDKNLMSEVSAEPVKHMTFFGQQGFAEVNQQLISFNLQDKQKQVIYDRQRLSLSAASKLTSMVFINNKLWVSYDDSGVYVFEIKRGKWQLYRHFHTANDFPSNQVLALTNFQGDIWAATPRGFVWFNETNQSYQLIKQPFEHSQFLFTGSSQTNSDNETVLFSGSEALLQVAPNKLKRRLLHSNASISKITVASEGAKDTPIQETHFWPLDKPLLLNHSSDLITVHSSLVNYLESTELYLEYWTSLNPEKKVAHGPRFSISGLTENMTLYVRSKAHDQAGFSDLQSIKISAPNNDFSLLSNSNILSIIFILALLVIWVRENQSKKNAQLKLDVEAEKNTRMELALLNDGSGIWDCKIEPVSILESIIVFYRKDQPKRKMTLSKYLSNIHPDDQVEVEQLWKNLLIGNINYLDATYRAMESSEWKWKEMTGQVNSHNRHKEPTRASGVWQLTNQEKHLEQQLNMFASALQSTQDIVVFLDKNLNVAQVNNSYERMTGFTRETLIGKNMVDIAFSRFTEKETAKIHHIVINDKHWQGESSVPRKNAASFPVDIRIDVITKAHREVGYVVVMSDISHLKLGNKSNTKPSFYDSITGLPNKTLGFDRLRLLLKRAKQDKQSLSIIFLSIDQYSELANTLSKDAMNSLLNQLCQRLLPYVQQDDVLAKYEPDTFLLILKLTEGEKAVLPLVNQLLREVAKPTLADGSTINISACAGISSYPNDGENWSELVTKAETALLHSKKQGKNLFKYYDEVSNKKALERKRTENKLARALSDGELFLVFQPVIALSSSKTVELDINLRWKPQNERMVYPSQFLAIAEEIGKLKDICEWLIEQAFSTLNRWNQEGLAVCINLNIPACYLLEKNAIEFIQSKMALYKINPKFLYIAIAEGDIVDKLNPLRDVSKTLHSLGIGLVLDDFGKNNANLGYLRDLKLHSIKIDRALVRNIGNRRFTDQLLSSFIAMSNELAIGTIAKGIETEKQLEFLTEKQCQFGQGFYISDPLNESQIRQLLLER